MKAITICQPYAHMIATGEKLVENRTWYTAHRGPLAVHAGKSKAWMDDYPDDGLAWGAIVAVCELVTCVHADAISRSAITLDNDEPLYMHEHAHGPWCFVLQNVRRLRAPVPCRGALNLWNVDEKTARIVKVQIDAQHEETK